MSDSIILKIAIDKLTEEFDNFISECLDEHNKQLQPSFQQ